MFCINCGENLSKEENYCPKCGYINKFKLFSIGKNEIESTNAENKSSYVQPFEDKRSKMSIAGFVLSVVGFFFSGLICGILGLIFSSIGLSDIKNRGMRGKGFAIAGLVLSIIEIVLGIALICLFAVYYAEMIFYLAEDPAMYY